MLIIGLMSGTSVDAIDAALVELDRDGDTVRMAVHAFVMVPFDAALRERVRALLPPHRGSTADVCEVNHLLGEAFAGAAITVADAATVPLRDVDLIASHGQTVYHQVAPGSVRSSLQLGSAAVIAERTGCTVAADFRPRDVAAGGEGAPLVPYVDALLPRDAHRNRAVQNIGGIGNVTYLPASGDVVAFDTGPGNVLIDEAVRELTGGAAILDRDGRLAAAGTVHRGLLAEWLRHPYFARRPPKSTGREQWGPGEARAYVAQARRSGLTDDDIVATLTALTARSIAYAYRAYLGPVDEVLVNGGGARNPTLVSMLQYELAAALVRVAGAEDGTELNPEAKEAVLFALLGYATLHGWPGNLPAATGARREVVLGHLVPGANYRALMQQVGSAPTRGPRRLELSGVPLRTELATAPADMKESREFGKME